MNKRVIFEMDSPYRDKMRITSFEFGDYDGADAENTVAIVGATRGNEVQQIYSCSRIVSKLKEIEKEGGFVKGKRVVVIPTINNFSMNTRKRFWSLDNTDINRMFPGYDKGETTQRIAYNVFEYVKDFEYGIHFTSYYLTGEFLPHIRMMKTGYETPELAGYFNLPYVYVRNSRPYDTTTLNYNWQIWDTKAFSLYIGKTESIDEQETNTAAEAVVNFLKNVGAIKGEGIVNENPKLILSRDIVTVKIEKAGILKKLKRPGDNVKSGETMGIILDPYENSVLQKLDAPVDGKVFFVNNNPVVYEGFVGYRIIR